MEEWQVTKKEAGLRLDRYLQEKKGWPRSFFMKAQRTNKIKVNRKKEDPSYRLAEGDRVISFVLEEKKKSLPPVDVLYEDDHILAVNKPAGLLSLDVTGKEKDTLLDRVNGMLAGKGQGAAYPVHRIDFNTSGILLFARDEETGHILDRLIKERKVKKSYLCVVRGSLQPPAGRMENYIFKDARKNRVYVTEGPVKGARTAITDYETKASGGGLSLVECRLLTGRTHQIRSQMAHGGHPLLGDDKYGSKEWNRKIGERRQLLCAFRVTFSFGEEAGPLSYLSGRTITMDRIPFVERYFKGYRW